MVERLCTQYGDLLLSVEEVAEDKPVASQTKKRKVSSLNNEQPSGILDNRTFYSFPTLEQLSKATEGDLLGLGFGYRAKYITGI